MYPLPFPTGFCQWGNSAEGLNFVRTPITFPLRAKCCQQARSHHRARTRQRIKDEKIRMRCRRLLDLPVQILNAFPEDTHDSNDHSYSRTFGFNHRPIANGRNALANCFHSVLDLFSIPTPVLAEESAQARRRSLL